MLSEISENDLAVVLGAIPGKGPLINLQQVIGLEPNQRLALPEREDKNSNPIKDASQVLEAFEHLTKYLKICSPCDQEKEENGDSPSAQRRPWVTVTKAPTGGHGARARCEPPPPKN